MSGMSPYATVRSAVYRLVDDDFSIFSSRMSPMSSGFLAPLKVRPTLNCPGQRVWSVSTVKRDPVRRWWVETAGPWERRAASRGPTRGDEHRRDDEEGDDRPSQSEALPPVDEAADPDRQEEQGRSRARSSPRFSPAGHRSFPSRPTTIPHEPIQPTPRPSF